MSDIWIGNCLTCGMPAGACRCVPPPDPRDAELTRLRAQLAAAESKAAILDRFLESLHATLATSDTDSTPEVAALLDKVKELQLVRQQLTTAASLLGECEPLIEKSASVCDGTENWRKADDLLTRIREATKGKT